DEDELAFLRILASGKTVYCGRDNKAGNLDSALIVGDCEARYAQTQRRRALNELCALGLDGTYSPDDIVYTIPGHSVTLEDIEKGFETLRARKPKFE
ncbi:MAG: hypothetical protein II727_03865, partial [Oscillospiraceae bacterium]|nr:hypothetical protein [Oscillospiraceae bacterium]